MTEEERKRRLQEIYQKAGIVGETTHQTISIPAVTPIKRRVPGTFAAPIVSAKVLTEKEKLLRQIKDSGLGQTILAPDVRGVSYGGTPRQLVIGVDITPEEAYQQYGSGAMNDYLNTIVLPLVPGYGTYQTVTNWGTMPNWQKALNLGIDASMILPPLAMAAKPLAATGRIGAVIAKPLQGAAAVGTVLSEAPGKAIGAGVKGVGKVAGEVRPLVSRLATEEVGTVGKGVSKADMLGKQVAKAETVPVYKAKLFRGTMEHLSPEELATYKAGKQEIFGGDVRYGVGTYYTSDATRAAGYGKVKSIDVELQHPFIIDTDDKASYIIKIGKSGSNDPTSREWGKAIRNNLEEQGYDGVVVKHSELNKPFGGGDEVVVFKRGKAETTLPPTAEAVKPEIIAPTKRVIPTETVPPIEPPKIPPRVTQAVGEIPTKPGMLFPDLPDFDQTVKAMTSEDFGRYLAQKPGIKQAQGIFNPAAVAKTPAELHNVGLSQSRWVGENYAKDEITNLAKFGKQEKVWGKLTDKEVIAQGPLAGKSVNYILEHPNQFTKKMTGAQKQWAKVEYELADGTKSLLERNGIPVNEVTIPGGGRYAPRKYWMKETPNGEIELGGIGSRREGAIPGMLKRRVFATEEEAIKAGFHPMVRAEVHYYNIKAAYQKVADKQAAEWLLTKVPVRGTGAPELLKEVAFNAQQKWMKAGKFRAAINRMSRGEKLPEATLKSFDRNFPELAKELRVVQVTPSKEVFNNLRKDAKSLIQDTYTDWQMKLKNRANARVEAMTVHVGEATVPAPAFQGKVFTGPEARQTAETLMKMMTPKEIGMLTSINKFNDLVRTFMLAGDVSQYGIQLIFLPGSHPLIAGNTAIAGTRAIFDPAFHAKFMVQPWVQDVLVSHPGLIRATRGAAEFTRAQAAGGLLTKQPFKYAGKALEPFTRGLETSLDVAGVNLAKAYDYLCVDAASTAKVDAFINSFRGLAAPQRLGVSNLESQFERATLLANQYNRGIASLLWSTTKGDITGVLARRNLTLGVMGVAATAVAISYAMGESTEEMARHFDPRNSKFMTWNIAGQNIGPGSKVRSVLRLLGNTINNPDKLVEWSMKNPALAFGRGLASPTIGSGLDILIGKNYVGDPTREGLPQFTREVVAKNLMPIWVQSVLLEPGSPEERVLRGGVEFTGGRAYPESSWQTYTQKRDTLAQQDYGKVFKGLNGEQKDSLFTKYPELSTLETNYQQDWYKQMPENEKKMTEATNTMEKTFVDSMEEIATGLLNKQITKEDYDGERTKLKSARGGGWDIISYFDDYTSSTTPTPEDAALSKYNEIAHDTKKIGGVPDYDTSYDKADKWLATQPVDIQAYVKRNLNKWIKKLGSDGQLVEGLRQKMIDNKTWYKNYWQVKGIGVSVSSTKSSTTTPTTNTTDRQRLADIYARAGIK